MQLCDLQEKRQAKLPCYHIALFNILWLWIMQSASKHIAVSNPITKIRIIFFAQNWLTIFSVSVNLPQLICSHKAYFGHKNKGLSSCEYTV